MASMDRIERVSAVLGHRQPDRPPVSFWYHFAREQRAGPAAVQAHLDHLDTFDLDFCKVMNDQTFPGAGTSPGLEELRELPIYRGDEPEFEPQLDLIAELARRLKDRMLITTTLFNAWFTVRNLYREAGRKYMPPNLDATADAARPSLAGLLREDRAAVGEALDRLARSLANFARKCVEAGANGVFLSVRDDWVDAMESGGPGTYASLVRPGDLRILRAVEEASFNMLHVCGTPLDFAGFAEYPVQAINWADRQTGPSIREAGPLTKPAICAGVDNLATLPSGTPEQCAAEVADALDQAGERPIMVAPGCTYDPERVPRRNLLAVCDAVRQRAST